MKIEKTTPPSWNNVEARRCMRKVIELSVKFGSKTVERFDYTCFLFVCVCIFLTMPFWAVPFCSNRTPKDSKRGISIHRSPISKKKIAQTWLVKLGGDENLLPKWAQIFVCLEHFTDDCFEVEHHYSLLGETTQNRPDATPTSFKEPWSVSQKEKRS